MYYMKGFSMVSEKVSDFASSVWGVIRRTPGWVIGFVIFLLWLCVHLAGKISKKDRAIDALRESGEAERKKDEAVAAAIAARNEQTEENQEELYISLSELESLENDLDKANSEGPSGIADAWNRFMGGAK